MFLMYNSISKKKKKSSTKVLPDFIDLSDKLLPLKFGAFRQSKTVFTGKEKKIIIVKAIHSCLNKYCQRIPNIVNTLRKY